MNWLTISVTKSCYCLGVVRPPGFGPGSLAWKANGRICYVLDQARLRPPKRFSSFWPVLCLICLAVSEFLERMDQCSDATRATYRCGFDTFERCFEDQSVDLLIAKIKSSELDAYVLLDKFVGWQTAESVAMIDSPTSPYLPEKKG